MVVVERWLWRRYVWRDRGDSDRKLDQPECVDPANQMRTQRKITNPEENARGGTTGLR